jgi:hypothetical protein
MKFLALCTVAITSVCYGAAHQTSSSSAQAKAVFEITHHSMPYQIATNAKGNLTCIIADSILLGKLPADFAKQVLVKMGENPDVKTFKSTLFELHAQHLSKDDIKAGTTSVQIALLIHSMPGHVYIGYQPGTTSTSHVKLSGTSYLTLMRLRKTVHPWVTPAYAYVEPSEKDTSTRLAEFGEQEHIRMLLAKGETDIVADLAKEFLSKTPIDKKINADFVLKINPTPDDCCLL